MVMAAGGMLAGCAWWLLFLAPPQPVIAHKPAIKPAPPSGAYAHAVKLDGLWGYIGRDGNWAIATAFNRVWPFSEAGHACVCAPVGNDEWFGMIDRSGQWLLPPRYSGVSDIRLIACGSAGLQWVAAARDAQERWGGVTLSIRDADRQVLVPFECHSGDEVFRVLGGGSK
jgi:hypothetical protein